MPLFATGIGSMMNPYEYGVGMGARATNPWAEYGSVGRNILNANPDAAYQMFTNQMFTDPNNPYTSTQGSAFGQYATSGKARDQAYNEFLGWASQPQNYNRDYVDFLQSYGPSLSYHYQQLPLSQQGYQNPGGLGRMHWSGL